MMFIGVSVYLCWFIYTAVFVCLTAACATIFGVSVREIKIGFGPALLRRRKEDFEFSLRLLPFSGSVAFRDPTVLPGEESKASPLRLLSPWQRVVTDLAGPMSNAALGLIALWMGEGVPLIISGVLGVYLALFNLLPLPALNGFDLIVAVTPSLRSRSLADAIPEWAIGLSLLVALGSQAGFIYVALARPEMLVSIGRAVLAYAPPN